jgi:hypothetical protein
MGLLLYSGLCIEHERKGIPHCNGLNIAIVIEATIHRPPVDRSEFIQSW